jgi:hypothetical protein
MLKPVGWRARKAGTLTTGALNRLTTSLRGEAIPMPRRALDPATTLPPRSWYSLQRWRRRAKRQLRAEPVCAMCLARGLVTAATVADHIVDHKGNWPEFLSGKLQSLCASCHAQKDGVTARGYSDAVGPDGCPSDPAHPWNRGR